MEDKREPADAEATDPASEAEDAAVGKASSLSVEELFGDLSGPVTIQDVAISEEAFLKMAPIQMERIEQTSAILGKILREAGDDEARLASAIEHATAVMTNTADYLDKVKEQEGEAERLRQELLDLYFDLKRSIDMAHRREHRIASTATAVDQAAKRLKQKKERKADRGKRKQKVARKRLGRTGALLIFVGFLIVLRLVYLYFELQGPLRQGKPQTHRTRGQVLVVNNEPKSKQSYTEGQPKIEFVMLRPSTSGLNASAMASCVESVGLTYQFIWMENGSRIHEETRTGGPAEIVSAHLPKTRLVPDAAYQVVVWAATERIESKSVESGTFTYKEK